MTPQFRLIKFSPAPEIYEPVNVGLLLVESDQARIEFLEDFPRLSALTPGIKTDLLRFWISSMQDELSNESPEQAPFLVGSKTAQITLGHPHLLSAAINNDLIDRLRNRFLKKHTFHARREVVAHKQVETLIDDVLHASHQIPVSAILKRAKPSNIFTRQALNILPQTDFKISRVIRGRSKILLLDGVNFECQTVQTRADEVAYAFFNIQKAKEQIEDIEQKEILKLSILFGQQSGNHSREEFLAEQIKRYAEAQFSYSDTTDRSQINRIISDAIPPWDGLQLPS